MKAIALALLLLPLSSPLDAQGIDPFDRACAAIGRDLNILLGEMTYTTCLPAGWRGDAISILLIAEQPVFSVEASRKAFLLAVMGAVGFHLNEGDVGNLKEVVVTDISQLRLRKGFSLAAETAARVQKAVKSEEMTLEDAYRHLNRALRSHDVQP